MNTESPDTSRTLTPADIHIEDSRADGLTLRLPDGAEYHGVRVFNPLPMDEELRYVCFTDAKGKELATVLIDDTLTGDVRALIGEHLARRYLHAVINRILKVDFHWRSSYWKVETDRGERNFLLTNITENVRRLSRRRLVITDVHENRFEIPDIEALDEDSRRELDKVL